MASREFSLIDWIRQQAGGSPELLVGIGDDTAVYQFPPDARTLITVDQLMEGTHFTFPPATPRQVGRKVLGVNLSDIAAMAGKPLAAVISLAFSKGQPAKFAEEFYAGLFELAEQFQVVIAGGDTNSWEGPFVAGVTLLGIATGDGPILRSGAKPGDWIFVTGSLGGSLSGHHLDFTPRVQEAQTLHQQSQLHSLIDISDGLVSDLGHILEESHCGAELWETAIPISEAARQLDDNKTALEHALHDGEDFELLFTVPPEAGEKLRAENPPQHSTDSHRHHHHRTGMPVD